MQPYHSPHQLSSVLQLYVSPVTFRLTSVLRDGACTLEYPYLQQVPPYSSQMHGPHVRSVARGSDRVRDGAERDGSGAAGSTTIRTMMMISGTIACQARGGIYGSITRLDPLLALTLQRRCRPCRYSLRARVSAYVSKVFRLPTQVRWLDRYLKSEQIGGDTYGLFAAQQQHSSVSAVP